MPKPSAPPLPTQVVVHLYGISCTARDEEHARELLSLANRTMVVRAICSANGRRFELRGDA